MPFASPKQRKDTYTASSGLSALGIGKKSAKKYTRPAKAFERKHSTVSGIRG